MKGKRRKNVNLFIVKTIQRPKGRAGTTSGDLLIMWEEEKERNVTRGKRTISEMMKCNCI